MNRRIFPVLPIAIAGVLISIDPVTRAAPADPKSGAGVFARRCSGCHALDSDKEGPRLRGVVGRKAGSIPGFTYSNALRDSGIVWNEALLGRWLENPEDLVKGTDMEFRVRDGAERTAIIEHLKSPE